MWILKHIHGRQSVTYGGELGALYRGLRKNLKNVYLLCETISKTQCTYVCDCTAEFL